MAIPAGISTALVHLDAPVSFIGEDGRIHATITSSIPLVWAATGTPIGNFIDMIALDPGVPLELNLPHVDQDGFLDGSGNTVTGWSYRIEVTYEKDGQNIPFPARDFQILVGQLEVDLALIPSGEAYVPVVAPILPVTSIDGLTGEVTMEELGLERVDNTNDLEKPISTATQAALNLKAPINNPTFTGTVSGVSKSMVGLGSADNTSDVNKPVSTAQAKLHAATSWNSTLGGALAGDYTGRWNSVGTGTDDRAAMQAMINAASQPAGSYQWSELQRRGVTVVIPAGVYIISAPSDGSPSLKIPEGVTVDFSRAMLFFDYPAAATGGWCAILAYNAASIIFPSFMGPSGRVAAPGAPAGSNTDRLYDGIRILAPNNVTATFRAHTASEIKGFKGASIRSIGGWVTRIDGPVVLSSDFGYIASNWPASNVYGLAHPASLPGIIGGVRLHTDVYFDGPYFNGNRAGGYLGVVTGDPTTPHALDFARSGGHQAYFKSVIFEHFANYAVWITGGLVSFTDCAFEEVGLDNQGMAWLQTVQSVTFKNHRINYTGASVPGPAGTNIQPFVPVILKINSVQNFTWEAGYYHNTYSNAKFADNAATVYEVLAPRVDDRAFTTDSAMYVPLGRGFSGKTLTSGDVEYASAAVGTIFKSPNGTRYRLTVGDDGALTTTAL